MAWWIRWDDSLIKFDTISIVVFHFSGPCFPRLVIHPPNKSIKITSSSFYHRSVKSLISITSHICSNIVFLSDRLIWHDIKYDLNKVFGTSALSYPAVYRWFYPAVLWWFHLFKSGREKTKDDPEQKTTVGFWWERCWYGQRFNKSI